MRITGHGHFLAALCLIATTACGSSSTAPPPVVATVVITPAADSVVFAGSKTTRLATVKDASGAPMTDKIVAWTSSAPAIASIDATTGGVTARSVGVTQITATSDGVKSTTLQVRVILKFATSASSLSAGDGFSCAVADLGATPPAGLGNGFCWGLGTSGQLGTGAATSTTSPASVSSNLTFAALHAGSTFACGRTSAGTAYCWGDNSAGQLGIGTNTSSNVPVPVTGAHAFTQLSVGGKFACGLAATGAYCWGDNTSGQLGSGSIATSSNIPVKVSTPAGVTFATISVSTQQQFACAVSTTNVAYCWGNNGSGQFGNGTVNSSNVPVAVPGSQWWADISAGATATCAITKTGSAYCWGDNTYAQLGDGTKSNSLTPVAVSGGLTFKALVTGGFSTLADGSGFSCGTKDTGDAFCWGDNRAGMLGAGLSTTENVTPIGVAQSGTGRLANLRTGTNHACAVTPPGGSTPAGVVFCWGANANGQLGTGTTTNANGPVRVAGQQ